MIAKLTNPLTGEQIEFDYDKIIEADEAPINYEAIHSFLKSIEDWENKNA